MGYKNIFHCDVDVVVIWKKFWKDDYYSRSKFCKIFCNWENSWVGCILCKPAIDLGAKHIIFSHEKGIMFYSHKCDSFCITYATWEWNLHGELHNLLMLLESASQQSPSVSLLIFNLYILYISLVGGKCNELASCIPLGMVIIVLILFIVQNTKLKQFLQLQPAY